MVYTYPADVIFKGLLDVSGIYFSPVRVRILNDQLIDLERTFILPGGLPNRLDAR